MQLSDPILLLIPIFLAALYVSWRLRNPTGKTYKNLFAKRQPVKLDKKIEIKLLASETDFIAAYKQMSFLYFQRNRWQNIFFAAAFVIILFSFWRVGLPISENLPPFIIAAAIVIFYIPMKTYLLKRSAARIYKSSEYSKGEVNFIFDSDNYEFTSVFSSGKSSWENVQCYAVTQNFVLLYIGGRQFLFIPKSSFLADDLPKVTQFLESNFENRKR